VRASPSSTTLRGAIIQIGRRTDKYALGHLFKEANKVHHLNRIRTLLPDNTTLNTGAARMDGRAGMDGSISIILILARQFLESLSLGLLDEQGAEATEKHEQGVDLEDVVQPGARVLLRGAVVAEGGDGALADDGADL
jgi:hypothetical protein